MVKQYYKLEDYHATRSIGYLLRSSSKMITLRIEALFLKEEISFVQWVILMNLRDNLCTTAAGLCQSICHDSGALTRILDQLEERGLIERKRSLKDRRIIELKLTKIGLKTTNSFLPRIIALYNELLGDFTKEEADTLIKLLTRLKDNIGSDPALKED